MDRKVEAIIEESKESEESDSQVEGPVEIIDPGAARDQTI